MLCVGGVSARHADLGLQQKKQQRLKRGEIKCQIKKEQQENELKGLHILLSVLEEEFHKGVVNEDGDTVLPEAAALKIAVLLEQ